MKSSFIHFDALQYGIIQTQTKFDQLVPSNRKPLKHHPMVGSEFVNSSKARALGHKYRFLVQLPLRPFSLSSLFLPLTTFSLVALDDVGWISRLWLACRRLRGVFGGGGTGTAFVMDHHGRGLSRLTERVLRMQLTCSVLEGVAESDYGG